MKTCVDMRNTIGAPGKKRNGSGDQSRTAIFERTACFIKNFAESGFTDRRYYRGYRGKAEADVYGAIVRKITGKITVKGERRWNRN